MNGSNNNEFRRDVHCPLCSYPTLKSTKTNRLMLRCDNCKLLMFANGHLSIQDTAKGFAKCCCR